MADSVLTRDGPVAVPLDYTVPSSGEIQPLMVRATLDGATAAESFYAVVQVIAPSGRVMGSAISDAIAAGASADCTWFPGAELAETAGAVVPGVAVETLLLDTTATSVTSSTVLVAGQSYLLSVQGTYSLWNLALNEGSPEANAMFPGSTAGRVSLQVGLDAETLFAFPSGSTPDTIGHITIFQINLGSGFVHIEPEGGPYTTPKPGHLYYFAVTGQGSTVSFRIDDSPLSDNYGKLQVTIQDPSAAGGSGTLVPVGGTDKAIFRTSGTVGTWEPQPDITEDDLNLSDVTTADVSTSEHGFAPKAPNDATQFLDGTGAYSVPATASAVAVTDGTTTVSGVTEIDFTTGATVTDGGGGVAGVAITGGGGGGGFTVVDYVERTTSASITATSEPTANTIVTGGGFTADGTSAYLIEFFAVAAHPNPTTGAILSLYLYQDGSSLGQIGQIVTPTGATMNVPVSVKRRIVPASGSHTYSIRGSVSTGTGVVGAGAGGSGSSAPAFIMVTKLA